MYWHRRTANCAAIVACMFSAGVLEPSSADEPKEAASDKADWQVDRVECVAIASPYAEKLNVNPGVAQAARRSITAPKDHILYRLRVTFQGLRADPEAVDRRLKAELIPENVSIGNGKTTKGYQAAMTLVSSSIGYLSDNTVATLRNSSCRWFDLSEVSIITESGEPIAGLECAVAAEREMWAIPSSGAVVSCTNEAPRGWKATYRSHGTYFGLVELNAPTTIDILFSAPKSARAVQLSFLGIKRDKVELQSGKDSK